MQQGKLIIFCAPSGSGKTTIVHRLLQRIPELRFSVSATTRPAREGEIHGKDYYFISEQEFRQRIDNNEFAEWEMVYQGRYYGTLKSEVQSIWSSGHHVIFDVDVKGGMQLKKLYGPLALGVFVMPPSIEILESRLRSRGTETEDTLKTRLEKAVHELTYYSEFDYVLHNNNLETAVEEALMAVNKFLGKEK